MPSADPTFESPPPPKPAPAAVVASPASPPEPRRYGRVNWLGLWTLYCKEVQRFAKIMAQTVLAPTITTLLFLAIFSLALGGAGRMVGETPFLEFLAPGLVMMAIAQNAFANSSSSMMVAKIQGNIVDLLMPPLSPAELTFAFTMGGATRGVLVGVATAIAMSLVLPVRLHDPLAAVYYMLSAAIFLSLVGLLAAIWADKFDHMAAINNFVITPLAFLSGTFYSVERLPGIWYTISQFNPFFYMIDGLRYAFIGRAEGSIAIGVLVLLAINAGCAWLAHHLLATGYKLKE